MPGEAAQRTLLFVRQAQTRKQRASAAAGHAISGKTRAAMALKVDPSSHSRLDLLPLG